MAWSVSERPCDDKDKGSASYGIVDMKAARYNDAPAVDILKERGDKATVLK